MSDRDIRNLVGNPLLLVSGQDPMKRLEMTLAFQVMTRSPSAVSTGTPLSRAAAFFADIKVGALPVVDEGARLIGLLSYVDVLRAVIGPKSGTS